MTGTGSAGASPYTAGGSGGIKGSIDAHSSPVIGRGGTAAAEVDMRCTLRRLRSGSETPRTSFCSVFPVGRAGTAPTTPKASYVRRSAMTRDDF